MTSDGAIGAAGSTPARERRGLRRRSVVLGWTAVALTTAIATFWATRGAIENF